MIRQLRRLRARFKYRHFERDLAREIETHRALAQEALEARGEDPQRARSQTAYALGNTRLAREDSRAIWIPWLLRQLGELVREFRQAVRFAARTPVLAAVIILSLAAGIGVNTVVFSWIQMFVMDPLPGVRNGGELQLVEPRAEAGNYPGTSWREYNDLRERLSAFEDLLAFRMLAVNVGETARTERGYALLVSGNYFSALGLRPSAGRFFGPDETARPGGDPVVVISHDYWQSRLGGADDVLQRTLRVNDRDLTIVGVAPERFQGTVLGLQFDFWIPATMAPAILQGSRELEERDLRGYSVMGRLKSGSSHVQAQTELDTALADLARAYPAASGTVHGEVLPFWQPPRGPQRMLLQALVVLQGLLLLVLLAVCGNTANLVLARASARQREIGVRLAIGATRWRIVRLLTIESLALAVPGAALGALIANWGTHGLRALPFAMAFPVRIQTSVDALTLGFAALLGIGCAVVSGAVPAVQLSGVDPLHALKSSAQTPSRSRLRNTLLGAQVTLALVVLIVAGLFLQGFRDTRGTDPGFRRDGILLATYDLTGRTTGDRYAADFARRLLEKLRALPEVEHAALSVSVPLDIHGTPARAFSLEGRARPDGGRDRALSNTVTPGYFAALGIPLVAGRDFADIGDATAPAQAIVNEEFVRRFMESGQPIGRRVETRGTTYTIAGVAKNALYDSFGEAPLPIIYLSYRDRPVDMGEIHLRTRAGNEMMLVPAVRRAVRELDAGLPIFNVRTMAFHIETNLFLRRIPARMFAVLGPLLLMLAAIGIYAVVSYAVAQRTAEIGLRLALGATGGRVVRQVMRQTLNVVVAGAAVGWIAVYMVHIHINSNEPFDPMVFVGVPAMLLAVAALACWIPARRGTRVDPMMALRQE